MVERFPQADAEGRADRAFDQLETLFNRMNAVADRAQVINLLDEITTQFTELFNVVKQTERPGDDDDALDWLDDFRNDLEGMDENLAPDEVRQFFESLLMLRRAMADFDNDSQLQTDIANRALRQMEAARDTLLRGQDDWSSLELFIQRLQAEIQNGGYLNTSDRYGFDRLENEPQLGRFRTITELLDNAVQWDRLITLQDDQGNVLPGLSLELGMPLSRDPDDQTSLYGFIRQAALQVDRPPGQKVIERKLSDPQIAQLGTILTNVNSALGDFQYENYRNIYNELRDIQEVIYRIFHENRVLEATRRGKRGENLGYRDYLRPSTKEIPESVYGEMMMFMGQVGRDNIDRAETIGFKIAQAIAEGRDPRDDLNEQQIRFLERLLERVNLSSEQYIQMIDIDENGDVLTQDQEQRLRDMIQSINEYSIWLNFLLDQIGVEPEEEEHEDDHEHHGHAPLEIRGRTPFNEASWTEVFYEAFRNRPKDLIIRQIKWEILELQRQENDYSEREHFSHNAAGVRFAGLKEWLKEKKNEADPDDDWEYTYYFNYFENRITMANMMGPYAASNMMTADVVESAFSGKNFPTYSSGTHDFFSGTRYEDRKDRYEHFQLVREIIHAIELKLDEQWDFTRANAQQYADHPHMEPGYFSLGRSAWMSGEDDYHVALGNYLVAQFGDRLEDEQELRSVIRIAYSGLTLTGGKADLFMSYFATGASPPMFAELNYELECYPEAKELNLASKKVMEIVPVVLGMHIDRRWLLKRATKIGLYQNAVGFGIVPNNGRLWGLPNAPLLTETASFDAFINTLTEEQADHILEHIRDDEFEERDASGYVRFRNLLRSIHLSEAKSRAISHYYTPGARRMQLVDEYGREDEHGNFIAPIVATARIMKYGGTEIVPENQPMGHYGKRKTEFHSVLKPTHEAVKKFREHAYSPPPKLEPGEEHHHENIIKLADDFFKLLGMTSPMKTQQEFSLVNWPEIVELLDMRLHVLFAAYRAAGYEDPKARPEQRAKNIIKTGLGLDYTQRPQSMLTVFHKLIATSGQTMGSGGELTWMSIATDRRMGRRPESRRYENTFGVPLSIKDYLLELVTQHLTIVPGFINRALGNEGRADAKDLTRRLDEGIWSGGPRSRGLLGSATADALEYTRLLRLYDVEFEDTGVGETFTPEGMESAKAEQQQEVNKSVEGGKK